MDQGKHKLAKPLLAVAFITALAAPVQALTYVEPTSDAGQTLATAQTTTLGTSGPLTMITGRFGSATDADLYKFTITSTSTFSATTVNATSTAQDTALFLFNSAGVAIATNDDAPGGASTGSTLPVGNSLYAMLPAGTYYIGISESGSEAVNTASQLLFNGYPGGDTTAVRGAAAGVNPTALSTFNNNPFDTTTSGAYEIDLTGSAASATVPEPRTWVSLGFGAIAAAFVFLRRRRQQTA